MRIDVTQEDIDRGQRKSARCCPVALAIQRRTRREIVIVGIYGAALLRDRDTEFTTCGLPAEASVFVTAFENEQPVQPFSFDLPLEASK